jgi:hypothetical protein
VPLNAGRLRAVPLYIAGITSTQRPEYQFFSSGLLQLRNELTHYFTNSLEKVVAADGEEIRFTSLPRPISNERACKKCPHLLTCALYQR